MSSKNVNEDLARERGQASFDPQEITFILDGGPANTHRRKHFENIVLNDPVLSTNNRYFQSQSESYEDSIHKGVRLHELKKQHNWTEEEFQLTLRSVSEVGFPLHWIAFVPAVERLGTDEQKAKWIPPSLTLQVTGCYSQTELGHGTNLGGLETTATFDPVTDEFIINSPTLTSMKFWPGCAAKTANTSLTLAKLIVNGKNHGMQPFIVPLRDHKTHQPLPGVTLGSIGPTIGTAVTDNGFIIFKNVRIPRENALMKYTRITRDGKVERLGGPAAAKGNYASMTVIRVGLLGGSYKELAKACTIAVRYSAVRRQSQIKPGEPEVQIMDFQTQQYKLFPYLATAYAFFFAYRKLNNYFQDVTRQIQGGDFSNLPDLHSISSGMKSFSTETAAEGIDILRRSCGGHGYLLASGLCTQLADALGAVTAEGEATILYLQNARALVKGLANGKTTGLMSYLSEQHVTCPAQTPAECLEPLNLVRAYRKRAQGVAMKAGEKMQSFIKNGADFASAFNQSGIELVRAAKAHCYLYTMETFMESIKSFSGSKDVKRVLSLLSSLYAVHGIVTKSGEFLETEALTVKQLNMLRAEELKLLAAIRPDAVALVDSFDINDYQLNSVLGAYDGNVYERLFEMAKKSPMNKTEVHPSYQKYLKPLIQAAKL